MTIKFCLATWVFAWSATLVAQPRDPNQQLRTAARQGHIAAVQTLLAEAEPGFDVDARDRDGWTALMYAVQGGHDGVVRLLLEAGADVHLTNNAKETPLHIAARRGRTEAARLLLEAGTDLFARDGENRLALYRAIEHGRADVIDLLQAAGAQAASIRKRFVEESASKGQTEPPKIVYSPAAPYTRSALRKRIEGTVVLIAVVRRDGSIGGVSVSKGIEESLDESALKAVRKWRFEPAVRKGGPVDAVLQIEMDFKLPRRHRKS